MAKFRKKPVVIEANRWDGDNARELMEWAHAGADPQMNSIVTFDGYSLNIRTLEGTMRADVGDMIIRGVKGEFYPCKPDIFAATYEPMEPVNGLCKSCGLVLNTALRFDEQMQCVVRQASCPNGCQHDTVWVWPEDATQAERDELGLVPALKKEG